MIRNLNVLLAALLAFAAHGACTARPVTASKWVVEVQCSSAKVSPECEEYSSDVELWEINGEVCGTLNQTTDRRSPDAWFSGRRQRDQVLVRFVDTFQSGEGVFGTAAIKIGKNRLTWTVLSTTEGQAIHSEGRYHRSFRIGPSATQDVSSCAELETSMSGSTIRLPLH